MLLISAEVPGSRGGSTRSCVFPSPVPTTNPFFKEGFLGSLCLAVPMTLGQDAPSPG